jgi:hypothetical protein
VRGRHDGKDASGEIASVGTIWPGGATALTLVLILALAGCGGGGSSSSQKLKPQRTPTPKPGGSFAPTASTPSMNTARQLATATLLPNGKVLIAGGFAPSGLLDSIELYDSASNSFASATSLPAMNAAPQQRHCHTAAQWQGAHCGRLWAFRPGVRAFRAA